MVNATTKILVWEAMFGLCSKKKGRIVKAEQKNVISFSEQACRLLRYNQIVISKSVCQKKPIYPLYMRVPVTIQMFILWS